MSTELAVWATAHARSAGRTGVPVAPTATAEPTEWRRLATVEEELVDPIKTVALLPHRDGSVAVATIGLRSSHVEIRDAMVGKLQHALVCGRWPHMAWTGDHLATVTEFDVRAQIWDVRTGDPISDRRFLGQRAIPTAVGANRSGLVLVARRQVFSTTVDIFDADGRQYPSLSVDPVHAPPRLIWTEIDDRLALVVYTPAPRRLVLWDPLEGAELHRVEGTAFPPEHALVVTRSGQMLLTGSTPDGVGVWDLATGEQLRTLAAKQPGATACTRAADGTALVAASSTRGTVQVWDAETGGQLAELPAPGLDRAIAIEALPDGRVLLAAGGTQLHVWSALPREPARPELRSITPIVLSDIQWERGPDLAALPRSWSIVAVPQSDGPALIAIGADSSDGKVLVCDLDTGVILRELTGHAAYVGRLACTTRADGRSVLVTGDREGQVRLWDPDSGTFLRSIEASTGWLEAVAVAETPDRRLLIATGGAVPGVRLWDGDTGDLLQTLPGPHAARSARMHVDVTGRVLVAAGFNGGDGSRGGRIWRDATQPDHFLELPASTGDVVFSDFHAHAHGTLLIACAVNEGEISIWDAEAGRTVRSFRGSTGETCLDWIPLSDGQMLLAVGYRWGAEETSLWDPQTGTCLLRADRPAFAVCLTTRSDGHVVLLSGAHGPVATWISSAPIATPPRLSRTTGDAARLIDRTPPEFGTIGPVFAAAWSHRSDTGHPVLAISGGTTSSGRLSFYDTQRGTVDEADEFRTLLRAIAWSGEPDPRLAVAGYDGMTVVMDHDTVVRARDTDAVQVDAVAWDPFTAESPQLATGAADGTVQFWQHDRCVRLFATGAPVFALAWGKLPDGRPVLVTGGGSPSPKLWAIDTGEVLCQFDGHAGYVHAARFLPPAGGRSRLVTGSADRTVRIWDAASGECLRILDNGELVWSLSVVELPDGRQLLATASGTRFRLWDLDSGAELGMGADLGIGAVYAVALTLTDGDELWLAVGGETGARVLQVPVPVRSAGGVPVEPDQGVAAQVGSLIALGRGGAWLPLGLLADLVELTGPVGTHLRDERLRRLTDHPGVVRLRELGWPEPARAALAALLAAGAVDEPHWSPPADGDPADLRVALATALNSAMSPATLAADLDVLTRAATRIDPRTCTLLRIIGPDAATLDPLLPLRLAHHVPALPALTPNQRILLASAHPDLALPRPSAASSTRTPGSVGVTRHGPISTVLLTEHALPADVFRYRQAHDQLLHRHHPAHTSQPVSPVTLVLDTSPPTFGAPESLLRLIAHLITGRLRDAGHPPVLITLDRPTTTRTLAGPDDLLAVWTSRSLHPPDLATALRTAATTPYPTLTLTTHHGAAAHPTPSAARQLITTHHPSHPPAHRPASAHHHHLDPDIDAARLAGIVAAVLDNAHRRRTA